MRPAKIKYLSVYYIPLKRNANNLYDKPQLGSLVVSHGVPYDQYWPIPTVGQSRYDTSSKARQSHRRSRHYNACWRRLCWRRTISTQL